MRYLPLLAFLAFLAAGSPASARTLVVAKAGGQHATVQAGLAAAAAGDTVLVKAGVYNERAVFSRSGSAAGGFITLKGEAGAVLDGAGLSGDGVVAIEGRSFVRVEGMEVRNRKGGGTPMGISVSGAGTDIEILGNLVHHIESPNGNAHGIAVYGDAQAPIARLRIEGNEIRDCKLGQSEALVLNGNVAGFAVIGNRVHDNDNIGIDFIGFEGTGPAGQDQAREGVCRGNRVWNNSSGTNPTYGGERSAGGIYVDGGRDILIEGNTIDNCDIGIEVASEHGGKATSRITVRNNAVSRAYQGNIMAGGYASGRGSAEDIVIVGNTTYAGRDGEIVLQHNCKGVAIRNNILRAGTGGAYLVASGGNNTGIVADNNLYFGAGSSSSGAWKDAKALFADPKLKNAPADLHIQADSPARDAGAVLDTALAGTRDLDGEARVAGGKPDIGADEVGGPTGLGPRGPDGPVAHAGAAARANPSRDGLGRLLAPDYAGRARFLRP